MHSKYIFVTGGVVSGLGKGITSASLGLILKSAGYSVDIIKLDPYLNVDPGTMSPFEHGEVYVLDDGSETDLDLGHYERFLDVNLTSISSVTSGKIYSTILNREREGKYLGRNVQLIPHVTNYIQEAITKNIPEEDHIRLIEIGGSTGDMEGEVFLESLRQFKQKMGKNLLHVHLGFVPYLPCSGEYKSKPFQNSIRGLLQRGLSPEVLIARYAPEKNKTITKDVLDKIALFGNVKKENVIKLPDVSSIYQVPENMYNSEMRHILSSFVGKEIVSGVPDFYSRIKDVRNKGDEISIGIVAKYSKLSDAYLSLIESLKIAGVEEGVNVKTVLINSEDLIDSKENVKSLSKLDGVVVAGGFGKRGMDGKIAAIKYVRENDIPFLGICLGLQMAVVEFAKNIIGLDAVSSEMYDDNEKLLKNMDVIVDFMEDQKNIRKKGGTMRLGGYDCTLEKDTLAKELYGCEDIRERHRHRYEVQGSFVSQLENFGMKISGKHLYKDLDGKNQFLVEIIELSQDTHPYFIATQSHPEFLSRPSKPHPLFRGLLKAAIK